MLAPAFRANIPTVAFELFADDAVLVDFDRGHYFSLNGTARDAWELLARRAATADDLARRLGARTTGDAAVVAAAAAAFLGRLVELNLVVPAEAAIGAPEAAPETGLRRPFEPPRIDVFKDLEELLLLDPIHDVAADGWPRAADAS